MINKYKHIVYVLFVSAFALGYGQSIQELQKLKAEYEKRQNQLQLPTGVDRSVDPITGLPRQAQITPFQPVEVDEELKSLGLKHFGYDFFTLRDTVAFWENLPTPANYQLGPGDELVLSLWGETQLRQTYTINREGKIYDDKVGLLNLTGKSMEGAKKYLKTQFGRIYATLNGKSPSTFI
ncbi:MAG: polysaccharide biosynthesis/export family protein, partial [Candidatus Marinimicrobia bacterium]|nr:polysaccharide biosynthesis/export family protein [Candidatus Neomarinimicrobiota bacterium]